MAIAYGHGLRLGELLLLPGGIAQYAVDETGRGAVGVFLPLLHRLVDGGGGGDFIQVGNLIKPQAKDIQHHQLELFEIGFHQGLELKVQAHLILDDAVDQACGQRRVPPGKLRSMELLLEGAVRPGALLAAGDERGEGGGSGVHGVLLSWCDAITGNLADLIQTTAAERAAMYAAPTKEPLSVPGDDHRAMGWPRK